MIICDNCKWTYPKKEMLSRVKEKRYSKGIKKVYHTCPKCKHEYIAYWSNQKVKTLQGKIKHRWTQHHQEIQDITKNLKEGQAEKEIDKATKELEKDLADLENQIKKEMYKIEILKQ